MVRYKLRPDKAGENERLIGEVFSQLADEQPEGTSYHVFKMPDGVSFIHVASTPEDVSPNPLTSLKAFQRFVAGIKERAEEPPVTIELTPVGKYLG
jgi:hypothetical protein